MSPGECKAIRAAACVTYALPNSNLELSRSADPPSNLSLSIGLLLSSPRCYHLTGSKFSMIPMHYTYDLNEKASY